MKAQDVYRLWVVVQTAEAALNAAAEMDGPADLRGECRSAAAACGQARAELALTHEALKQAEFEAVIVEAGPIFISSEKLIAEFRRLEIFGFQASGLAMASESTQGLGNNLAGELIAFRRVIQGGGQ